MLPGNKLSNAQYKNLYVYAGTQHPHEAQKPKQINFNNIK
jgi:large subunit ribosomal protein L13